MILSPEHSLPFHRSNIYWCLINTLLYMWVPPSSSFQICLFITSKDTSDYEMSSKNYINPNKAHNLTCWHKQFDLVRIHVGLCEEVDGVAEWWLDCTLINPIHSHLDNADDRSWMMVSIIILTVVLMIVVMLVLIIVVMLVLSMQALRSGLMIKDKQ